MLRGNECGVLRILARAYFEGQRAGESIAECINGNTTVCSSNLAHENLHGTTKPGEYDLRNGWSVSSFLTYGF